MAVYHATKENYDTLTAADGITIVDFYTTTCGPCKLFSRVLDDLQAELPFVSVVKVNLTDVPALGERFEIHATPTILFYKDGQMVERRIGVIDQDELQEIIGGYLY
ncbi:MAG: thioredoxin family protein [Oscillospiraceae bacterium]|nr:thioredoxin family protein [Oscillospiraceae bacterium]MBR4393130.1 thioredoxin family protein [Oscillospiraceae bacterium]